MDGATYHGPVELDARLQMHVFAKAGGSMGFCWASASQPVELSGLPRDVVFYDIMGNRLADPSIALTDSVVYFCAEAAPDGCTKALKAVSVRGR